jgi:hypothetical protein
MATFKGTSKEFKRFIGPHLRNVVNQITRRHKKSVGSCEHCGESGELEAAHVHGRGRLAIIESLLGRSMRSRDQTLDIDLCEFDRQFKQEHSPVENAILVLCNACHRKYDKDPSGSSGKLPITLDPPRAAEFVRQLLRVKVAVIQTHFRDGTVKSKLWRASKFSRTSSLFGNLRTRLEFRKGNWRRRGISKVHVRIGRL